MSVYTLILAAALATYLWRFLGALLAGRITVESPWFRYATFLSYAMVGALILKLIVYPQGATSETALWMRLLAIAVALVLFYLGRKNAALGAWAGVVTLFFLNSPPA